MADQSVLITGGTGAFAQAYVRRCLADGAARVALLSRSESKQAELRASLSDPRVTWMVGDVREYDRMLDACRGVDIVIHSAALKRVEVCESERREAHRTNVQGSENVARACTASGVRKAILLSTDKAANPATYYGVTKLAAEGLWIGENVRAAGTHTRFAVTRYGNVANSTGSVLPIWRLQRASGELSITDPRMSRFLMHMDQALDLVMRALADMRGGEIFVPIIGATTIGHLAHAFAPECDIRCVGARPGEKLHETLVTEDEARRTHEAPTHLVIEPTSRPWDNLLPLTDLPLVPEGFTYRSDMALQIASRDLERMVAA